MWLRTSGPEPGATADSRWRESAGADPPWWPTAPADFWMKVFKVESIGVSAFCFFPAQLCSLLNILLQTGGNFSQRKILLVEKYWVQADCGGCEGRPLFCVKEGTPADKSVWDSVLQGGGCTFLELNHHLTVWHMWLFSCLQGGTESFRSKFTPGFLLNMMRQKTICSNELTVEQMSPQISPWELKWE